MCLCDSPNRVSGQANATDRMKTIAANLHASDPQTAQTKGKGGVRERSFNQSHSQGPPAERYGTRGKKGCRPACHSPKHHAPALKHPRSDEPTNQQHKKSPRSSPVAKQTRQEAVTNCTGSPSSVRKGSPPTLPSVPVLAYAGAKFNEPPSPKVLPKPPVHWFGNETTTGACTEMTSFLKVMLKVQA